MGTQGPAVTLQAVSHTYEGSSGTPLPVLHGLDLAVAPGEVVAVMGPSGSGKSTLLNLVAGRLQPQRGNVRRDGAGAPARISRVFQESALLPWRTVAENVRLPLELTGVAAGTAERVTRAMELAGVAEYASFRPSELSGGLASRAAIARALVTEPDLILLDEPFGSLDEVTAESVMVRLAAIVERIGATTILVTHSVDQAVFLADRVVVLSTRPARVAAEVRVEHPRPRTLALLSEDAFTRRVHDVRRQLRAGVA